MAISLKDWLAKNPDEQWALDVLKQNRVQDDSLDQHDFELRYGRTAAEQVWPEIEAALNQNDKSAYDLAFAKLQNCSRTVLTDKFMNGFAPLESRLKKFGITKENANLPQVYKAGVDTTAKDRDAATALLAGVLTTVYQDEYGKTLASDKVTGIINNWLSQGLPDEIIPPRTLIEHGLKIYGSNLSEDVTGISEYVQEKIYAPEQLNEYKHADVFAAVEQKFNLDIRFTGEAPTQEQVKILDQVLTKIAERRPQDLQLLKTLELYPNDFRVGGVTEANLASIELTGPFAPPNPNAAMPAHYAASSLLSAKTEPTELELYKLLCHELGHLVEHRDGPKASGYDVASDYETLEPDHAHEWFAEDYSVYLASDGLAVADISVGGEIRPNYDERLTYFRNYYPLANNDGAANLAE
jgi:hypothetical protein